MIYILPHRSDLKISAKCVQRLTAISKKSASVAMFIINSTVMELCRNFAILERKLSETGKNYGDVSDVQNFLSKFAKTVRYKYTEWRIRRTFAAPWSGIIEGLFQKCLKKSNLFFKFSLYGVRECRGMNTQLRTESKLSIRLGKNTKYPPTWPHRHHRPKLNWNQATRSGLKSS